MTKRKLSVEVPVTPETFITGLARLPVTGGIPGGDLVVDLQRTAGRLQRCRLAVRGGVASWVQRVEIKPRSLTCRQIEGDFSRLEITWTAEDHDNGATAVMVADFATSVPHFAGAIDSAAGRALVRVALAQAKAVAGIAIVIRGHSALADPEPVLTAAPRRQDAPDPTIAPEACDAA